MHLLLLRLRVGHALLIGQILLLLRSRILPCVLLLLVMMDSARGPGNYGGGGYDTAAPTSGLRLRNI